MKRHAHHSRTKPRKNAGQTADLGLRFQQLLQLAKDGNEVAASDLWREFATDLRTLST
jgi:hypothetical protein